MGIMADIDETMYSCGIDILHPGGLEKSLEMAEKCGISMNQTILDIGSGKGATACAIALKFNCRITGIDQNPLMIKQAIEKSHALNVSDRTDFILADSYHLPFPDNSFDVVIAECSTVLLDRNLVLPEMLRTVRPGGYLGDLEMTWRKPAPAVLKKQVLEIWDGFSTMTIEEWETFFSSHGLRVIESSDFSDKLIDMEKSMINELGLRNLLKLAGRLISNPPLLKAMIEYRKIFKTWNDYIGYGYIIGRKAQDKNENISY